MKRYSDAAGPTPESEAAQGTGIIGAPSSIGLRPDHRTGEPQQVDQAPSTLRSVGIVDRLRASDRGDVVPPSYRDFERPPGRPRNEMGVVEYSHSLGRAIGEGIGEQRFLVVLGGDCSIVLGCLVGPRHASLRVGLAYVDAHADFATPEESETGSAASMALALAVGHGDSALARLFGSSPLVQSSDVALVGRRDFDQPSYGHAALGRSGILDLPGEALNPSAIRATASAVLERVARADLGGFWIHVDCDVLNPDVMPATGALEPGGPTGEEFGTFLNALANHPKALGLALTLYDPSLDIDGASARLLVELLAAALRPDPPPFEHGDPRGTR
jgi:arginase